jgi:ankyrin repeat protein
MTFVYLSFRCNQAHTAKSLLENNATLSLENNATTNGTAAIIEEFGTEFGVPCEHAKEYLPFDDTNKVFNIEAARKHHVFLASLKEHKKEMADTIRILKNAEKELQFNLIEENDNVNDDLDPVHFTDINNKQKVNAKFDNVFKNMMKRMWEAQQGDEEKFENFIGWLHSHRNAWENVKDFNGRTLIHAAVENDNLSMVKTLVCAGVNINAKERCGATALTIAVIKKNEEICKFLLENFAICDDQPR